MQNVVQASYDQQDECVFGTPYWEIQQDFKNLYRAQIGICQIELTSTHASGAVGFYEVKGLYMCERYVRIPFYGQTPKALVKRFKRIQKLLEQEAKKALSG